MEKSFLLHFTIVRNYIFSLLYLRTFHLLYCGLHHTMALQQFFSLKPLMAVLRQREKQERKKTYRRFSTWNYKWDLNIKRQIRLQVYSVLRDLPKRHSTRLQKKCLKHFCGALLLCTYLKSKIFWEKKSFVPYLREIQHKRA